MSKILSVITVVVLLCSIIPLPKPDNHFNGDLKNVIAHIQQLQSTSTDSTENFSSSFLVAINSLRVAAGINTAITQTKDRHGSEQDQIILSVKHFFLPTKAPALGIGTTNNYRPFIEKHIRYTSYIPLPEKPPPSVS